MAARLLTDRSTQLFRSSPGAVNPWNAGIAPTTLQIPGGRTFERDPGALEDVAAKSEAKGLAERLRRYVEIDEFRQVRATGEPWQCGELLLCWSKIAQGE